MIEITDLTMTVPGGSTLLQPISLHARPGTLTALTGPSGSGKSTLLRALLGHVPTAAVVSGSVRVGDHSPLTLDPRALRAFRRHHITYTGQDPAAALNPTMRIRALLTECADPEHAEQALAAVELPDTHLRRRPAELSGGEQRRVALARALARRTPVLILDEPFAGLHGRLQRSIARLLRTMVIEDGMTLVVSGHHHDVLHEIADEVRALGSPLPGSPLPGSPLPGSPLPGSPLLDSPPPASSTASSSPISSASAAPAEPVLAVTDLRVTRDRRPVLEGIDLIVGAGEAIAVVGPSGAGKSTLARAIVGLQRTTGESVSVSGRAGFVPQDSTGSLNPRRTVAQTLRKAPDVAAALRTVELDPQLAQRYPHELSGGQRQRVALARALTTNPALLVCDEITSALDPATADAIMGLLDRLRREQRLALLVISHDMRLVARYCTGMSVLESGRIVESGPVVDLLDAPQHDATLALIG
ncbi:ABC transporter ATP-binding protein [Nocardia crassostreae]|uniref:ABC transporter ATP-binding protein n=1 Tax=Nocardia crassostreae TaxID=53428 RepID=UPI00083542B7|nr:ATP-binding cassette domain-containing protein [Nocardia crassostreae]